MSEPIAKKHTRPREEKTEEEPIPVEMTEQKERKKINPGSFFARFSEPRNKRIVGAALTFFAIILFFSFASYLFTWKEDQSIIDQKLFSYFFDSSIQASNWLGKMGAILSHLFIFKLFGFPSFGIVLILFVLGFKLLFEVSLLKINLMLKQTLFAMLYSSVLLDFFVSSEFAFLGGGVGYEINLLAASVLGKLGAGFLLILIGFIYFIVNFNPSFESVKAWFEIKEQEPVAVKQDERKELDFLERIKQMELIDDDLIPVEEIPQKQEPATYADDFLAEDLANEGPLFIDDTQPELADEEIYQSLVMSTPVEEEIAEEIASIDGQILSLTKLTEEEELSEKEVERLLREQGQYDPTLELSTYQFPGLDLMEDYVTQSLKDRVNKDELLANQKRIVDTLANYKIEIAQIKASVGPTVTLYEIVPAPGVRISKIQNLENDIALSLAALGIRIIAPIPGKGTIGIEVPNAKADIVPMKSLLKSEKFINAEMDLPLALGKTISNETFVIDLAKMPHLLMAGATGQGKSVGLNAILVSLLYKKHPSQIKLVLVDPKKVELTLFNKIERHFLAKLPGEDEAIITDTQKVVRTLNSLCIEMDNRYDLLKEAQVRNLKEYNKKFVERRLNPEKGHKFLPYIIVVIDEFADLIMTAGKEVEMPIARIAQLARAVGIHLIIATQRPSVNIITGTIKANFPARIAFRVSSKIDSRTILDTGGADQLIGRGDMLLSTGNDLIRIQCGFVDTPEVERITDFIGSQRAFPTAYYLPEPPDAEGDKLELEIGDRDDLFDEAAKIIVMQQQGSASLLQRKLQLGYNRAGRLIDQMEAAGIVGPYKGSKAREVLFADVVSLEQFLKNNSK